MWESFSAGLLQAAGFEILNTIHHSAICSFGCSIDIVVGRFPQPHCGTSEKISQIADGKRTLRMSDGSEVPGRSANRFRSSTKDYTPIAGRDCQSAWKRDSNEITDTNTDRGGSGSCGGKRGCDC